MLKSFLVLVISCIVLSVAQTNSEVNLNHQQQLSCGPNEVYHPCLHCPSEDSCYDRNQIACLPAILPCNAGCICKEGFIRKTLGRECIPKEECGAPCEIFTHYSECQQSSKETCSSISSPSKSDSDNEEACTAGCSCWLGYYRADENSPCRHRCLCPELRDTPECEFWRTPLK